MFLFVGRVSTQGFGCFCLSGSSRTRVQQCCVLSMQETQVKTNEESIKSVVGFFFCFFFSVVASGNACMTEIETKNQIMLQGLSQTIDLTESPPFHFHMWNLHRTKLIKLITAVCVGAGGS